MSRLWLLIAAIWASVALPGRGQDAGAAAPAFNAVPIRPHDANDHMTRVQRSPDRYMGRNVSLKALIVQAHDAQVIAKAGSR